MQTQDKITVKNPAQLPTTPQITTESYNQNGWKFVFKKSGILTSKVLDQLADDLHLQGIPDVVYGNSSAELIFADKGFTYQIIPQDSLSYINIAKQKAAYKETYDKTGDLDTVSIVPSELKIKQAEHWKDKKITEGTDIKVLDIISDWTYSTPYKGTIKTDTAAKGSAEDVGAALENLSLSADAKVRLEKTEEDIPLHNLTANNPIKWYSEFLLFEDELGDCGLSQSIFRFRVMGDCFFGLLRHYLRIDDVVIRIYDTRLYHEFGKNYILREFSSRENSFDGLKAKGFKIQADFITNHKQSDVVYQFLEPKLIFKDKVIMF